MAKTLKLTNAGKALRLKCLSRGEGITFTRLIMGDGTLTTQEPSSLTGCIHEVHSIPVTTGAVEGDYVPVGGAFDRKKLASAFRFRELAVGAMDPDLGEVAYAYAYDGDEGEYIDPSAQGVFYEEYIQVNVFVGEAPVVCNYDESLVWATKADLRARPRVHLFGEVTIRDPTKPTYGLGGGEDSGAAALLTGPYTGRAAVAVVADGQRYDALNVTPEGGENLPEGTIIIKMEE